MTFLSEAEIELDFEGIDTADRRFVVRREVTGGITLINFDAEFSRLYRGVPCLTAGTSLNVLAAQMFTARGDELPADEEWARVRQAWIDQVQDRWQAAN